MHYTNDDIPEFREHETSLNLWWDNPEDPRIPGIQRQVIRHLRDRGFRINIDPEVKKHYRRICKDHHLGRKGELWVKVVRGGRHLEIEFWQEIITENPNGGRYDFQKREKMPYQIGKAYELERALLAKLLGLSCALDAPLRGLAYIQDQRTNRKHTFFPCPLGEFKPVGYDAHNAKAGDGTILLDGTEVAFIADYGPSRWRIQHGIAYHNINNMWWVLLPGDEVQNLASHQLHQRGSLPVRPGRHVPAQTALKHLKYAKEAAVKAENYERAAAMRDALKRMEAATAQATA